MIGAVFVLLVSTLAPDGWTPPVTLGMYTGADAATECAIAWLVTDKSGTVPPVVSKYPVWVRCEQIG